MRPPALSVALSVALAVALVVLLALPAAASSESMSGGTVRFSAAADYGRTSATTATLRLVDRVGARFHLALGDLSYDDATEAEWCRYVTTIVGGRYPFALLAGNHESFGRDGDIETFARCLPNRLPGTTGRYARQYYMDIPATNPVVRVLMISPGLRFGAATWHYKRGDARYRWTARTVDSARRAGIRWVVVGMHHPCLSMGRYGCAAGADIMNLLVRKRVDLVLTGHEHIYQRTHQIAAGPGCRRVPTTRFDRDCVAARSSSLRAGRGPVFITAGTGGTALRAVDRRDAERGYFAAWSGRNSRPRHGIVTVEVNERSLSARFVGSTAGTFTDQVTIRG